MAGRVHVTSNIIPWSQDTAEKLDGAVLEMATDIHRIAGMTAPKETHALVNSGRIERVAAAHYRVIFGGGAVPYARIRHYINKKTPSSLLYLKKAGDTTSRNVRRYLRGIAR